MINRLYRFYLRWFKVISEEKAKKLGLKFYRNIYGDEINRTNCRSIWLDGNNKRYRVKELYSLYH